MRNGHYELYEVELAAAGRGDRDGKVGARANAAAIAERWQRDRTKAADLAAFTARQEALSRERRARSARIEQLLQESRALRALADLKFEARLTTQGQLLAAARRGGW